MLNQVLNLTKLKLNYKIILITVTSLVLLILFLTQKKIFFLLTATMVSVIISLIIRFFEPIKIIGVELVTFSTILVGSFFGSLVGTVFGISLVIIHLIVANYHGGPYIAWILPEYALIGAFSGFLTDAKMLVVMVVGINIVNSILTLIFYRENFGKHFIFSLGNAVFNAVLILKIFSLVTSLL